MSHLDLTCFFSYQNHLFELPTQWHCKVKRIVLMPFPCTWLTFPPKTTPHCVKPHACRPLKNSVTNTVLMDLYLLETLFWLASLKLDGQLVTLSFMCLPEFSLRSQVPPTFLPLCHRPLRTLRRSKVTKSKMAKLDSWKVQQEYTQQLLWLSTCGDGVTRWVLWFLLGVSHLISFIVWKLEVRFQPVWLIVQKQEVDYLLARGLANIRCKQIQLRDRKAEL